MGDTQLILHVKGTQETRALPKEIVRAAIKEGQLTRSQLIWSVAHNAWKQVRELPHLLPSQKLAPPPPTRPTTALPTPAATVRPSGTMPRIAGEGAAGQPQVRRVQAGVPSAKPVSMGVKVKGAPAAAKAPNYHVPEEKSGPNVLVWLCLGLIILIIGAVAANFVLVDRPLTDKLAQTNYAQVTVYAHLGAFMQPGDIVIHIPVSSAVTRANLVDFLVALAHSTPPRPVGEGLFDRVSLTSGWTGQYSFSGYAWKELGDMSADDNDARKAFILDQMSTASGEPLVGPGSGGQDGASPDRDRVWQAFENEFTRS